MVASYIYLSGYIKMCVVVGGGVWVVTIEHGWWGMACVLGLLMLDTHDRIFSIKGLSDWHCEWYMLIIME